MFTNAIEAIWAVFAVAVWIALPAAAIIIVLEAMEETVKWKILGWVTAIFFTLLAFALVQVLTNGLSFIAIEALSLSIDNSAVLISFAAFNIIVPAWAAWKMTKHLWV